DKERRMVEVDVKNRFSIGDELEILLPQGNRQITLERMENSSNSNPINVAPGSGHRVRIPWDDENVTLGLITRQL
ncbi:MAG: U32 family peptidase C-terminal domain-containing protein, partial [Pseudomonadota bacterium]|nr:U32 family peptidase C-terminal domain-containing protein [Pseudomonadota bacterium]